MANEELIEIQNSLTPEKMQKAVEIAMATPGEVPYIELTDQEKELDSLIEALPDTKPAPEDYAAAYIERHLAAAKSLLKQLGGNAVERVFLNVMAGEFSKKEYNPVTENERSLAHHFNECVNLRAKIVFSQEFERLAQAYAKEEEDLKKIDQLTQEALTPEAKQMLAEAGNKVEIKVD